MRALVLRQLIGPAGLELADVAEPVGDDLVHIEVRAAGVNFPDLLMTRGEYQGRQEPPFVLGNEVAGDVIAAPQGSPFAPGDRVVALCGTGGYAERVAVAPQLVAHAPATLDPGEAVATVANHQTAYFALALRAHLLRDERVVVLGAAGGLGSACIQVAAALGARVTGVVHRDRAADFVRSLGAEHVVRLREGWGEETRRLLGGADVIADPVGGDPFDEAVRVLAPGGRLVVLGFAAGAIPSIKVNRLLLRNVALIGAGWGEWLRTHPNELQLVAAELSELMAGGMRPPVTGRYPLERGRDALDLLATGGVQGKVVIEP